MERFNIGNVFKLCGTISIVTGERTVNGEEVTDWVSFEFENSRGTTSNVTKKVEKTCWDCQTNIDEYPDHDCTTCNGTGHYKKEISGMDQAIYLAPNVKTYILKRLLKNFEF